MKNLLYTFLCLLILFSICGHLNAQVLRGKVLTEDGKQVVSFAIITIDGTNKGTSCDPDGNFTLTLNGTEKKISIQMLGFKRKDVVLESLNLSEPLTICLQADGIGLKEVEIKAGEDPANPIIRKVIRNMPKYDIANLPYYSCNTYAKTYFTLSDREGNEDFYNKEPTKNKDVKKMLDRSYLLMIESVTEKKYRHRNKTQEKIIASRVSGFKSAPFGAFATQLQSFTFYENNIELIGIKYINPLCSGTFKRYSFIIQDTLIADADTTLIIAFKPKKNVAFKSMKGLLYINKKEYVLSKVSAEQAVYDNKETAIKVLQSYRRIKENVWFPDQVNTELLMNTINSNESTKAAIVKGVSKVYISDVNTDSAVVLKNSSIEVYNAKDFEKRHEEFWYSYRRDTLTTREKNTYTVVDSIGKKMMFEQKMKAMSALVRGKIPMGYVDFELKHLLRVNEYEGLRAGLGISTSNKLSRWFSIGGYGGYGFRDKAAKYGGSLRINMDKQQNNFLLIEGASEVEETAGTTFNDDNGSMFSTSKFRDFLISRMDKTNSVKTSLQFRPVPNLKVCLFSQVQNRHSPTGFRKNDSINAPVSNDFILNTAGIQLCYRPGEKFIESFEQMLPKGSKLPVIYLNYIQGLQEQIDVYKGEYSFSRMDLRLDHLIPFKVKGYFSWQIQAGKVIGDVPYSILYNNKGSRLGAFTISVERSFETMYMNEFISSEYAAAFLCINTGKLLRVGTKYNPSIDIVHNYGIGNVSQLSRFTNTELNDLSKGYTEAGIRIKDIIKSSFTTFGIGVFYRYGNYAMERTMDNFVYKLAISFAM